MATIGGIFLIIGAIFTFRGEINFAIGSYFVADVAWVILAYNTGDIQGTLFVLAGMSLGLAAFIKMNLGKMRKNLKW